MYLLAAFVLALIYSYLFYRGYSKFIDGHRSSVYLVSVMSTKAGLELLKQDTNCETMKYSDVAMHFKQLAQFNIVRPHTVEHLDS